MTTPPMTAATIRIRARMHQGFTEVQLLMPHPMETGLRLNEAGQVLPRHHITDVIVTLDARTVFSARMTMAVSRDPLLGFRLGRAIAGQRLRVSWTDNLGFSRSDETVIA
jgi:sulfur-oxidizing protein SoxZ